MDHQALRNFLHTPISLRQLDLLIVDIPQKEVFQSAIGQRRTRKALIVIWTTTDNVSGYGECSCRPDPFYSHEFVDGALQVIKAYLFPLVAASKTYGEVLSKMQQVRGWEFTKAAVEFAMNDAIRRTTGQGIIEASGLRSINNVPVGISIGLFNSVKDLHTKLGEIASLNYRRLKFKISKGYDNRELIKEFGKLEHPNISFDANGSFTEDYFSLLNEFAKLGKIIEQPYPPSGLYLHQDYLKDYTDFRICLDEEIHSYGDMVSNTLQMQQLNIKPGRVGGLWNTLKMIDYCQKQGLDAWIGGMFETGIGRAQNLQVAALLHDARAHDLSPSNRYFNKDIVEEPIEMENGLISSHNFLNPSIDSGNLKKLTIDKLVLKND